jgi:hypothetical protein
VSTRQSKLDRFWTVRNTAYTILRTVQTAVVLLALVGMYLYLTTL